MTEEGEEIAVERLAPAEAFELLAHEVRMHTLEVLNDAEEPLSFGELRDRVDVWIAAVREDETRRRIALASAVVVGLGLVWVHWIGLVVGGALVGLTRRSLRRAIVGGLAFGALAVAVTVLASPTMDPGEFLGLSRVALVTGIVGLVAPAWGALLRAAV